MQELGSGRPVAQHKAIGVMRELASDFSPLLRQLGSRVSVILLLTVAQ